MQTSKLTDTARSVRRPYFRSESSLQISQHDVVTRVLLNGVEQTFDSFELILRTQITARLLVVATLTIGIE